MTRDELVRLFAEYDKTDFLEDWKIVGDQPSGRWDLCGLIRLDKLCPGKSYILGGASHDMVYLDADLDELAKVASPEDVLYLVRCGIVLTEDSDCLALFV